jgi:hypothetical protein
MISRKIIFFPVFIIRALRSELKSHRAAFNHELTDLINCLVGSGSGVAERESRERAKKESRERERREREHRERERER